MMRLFILLLFICNVSFADVYVLVNDDNTIQSIDIDNTAQVEKGQSKVILNDNYEDFSSLTYPDNYYILKGNKVKLNTKKLEEESQQEAKAIKKQDREAKINERIRAMAEAELIKDGLLEAEVN